MVRMLAVARAASADAARRSRAWLAERRLWEWNYLSRKFTWASISFLGGVLGVKVK